MVPAHGLRADRRSGAAQRFGAIYFPHGAIHGALDAGEEGRGFTFSESSSRSSRSTTSHVISNLEHALAYGSGATGNHNRSSAAFLSGAEAASGAQPQLGITMDQVVAKQLGPGHAAAVAGADDRRVRALSCGDGLSCAYRNTISWQSETSPLPMQNNPQVVFEQLFGDGANDAQRAARRKQSLSLLDSVLEQSRALQQKLPAGDRERMDRF